MERARPFMCAIAPPRHRGSGATPRRLPAPPTVQRSGCPGLTPDTEYEAEASLTSDFGVSETVHVFRTLRYPSISKLEVKDETQ